MLYAVMHTTLLFYVLNPQTVWKYTHTYCVCARHDAICVHIFHFALVHFCTLAHHRSFHPSISVVGGGVVAVVVVDAIFALFHDSV